VASTPYQGFTGEETAPINAQQQTGIGNINTAQGNIAGMGPISAADIQKYQDPYTNQVIGATQADFDVQNQRANSTVLGNAAAQGALGGDRAGVAQALTQEAQNRVQAPVIAGLRSQGYQSAVNTAENQQKFGLTAQQAALQGAQSQIGAGTLQQQTQQAQDTQARQDYYQQQGYPFQVAQWLAAIDTGVGGSMGSTSTSTGNASTEGPTPNPWSQAAGLGLTAASMFIANGGRVMPRHNGGRIAGFAAGGTPYDVGQSWVPTMSIQAHAPTAHATLPSAPQAPKQQGLSQDQMKGFGVLAKGAFGGNPSYGGGNMFTDEYGGSSSNPLPGLSADDYGSGFGYGGMVRRKRYAGGGFADDAPSFDERFDAAFPNRTVAGVGASKPAYDLGPTYDDGGGPMRLSAPEDLDAWRVRVDRDNGRSIMKAATDQNAPVPQLVAAPADEAPTLPAEITAGSSRHRTPFTAPDDGTEAPDVLGYAGSPRIRAGVGAQPAAPDGGSEQPGGGLLNSLGIKITPELRQGLLQAGLAMMASTRGGPGSFLGSVGEAGMAGVGAYSKSIEEQHKADLVAAKMQLERERFDRPYSQMTMAEKAAEARSERPYHELTAAQKLADERARQNMVPTGWKENDDGTLSIIPNGPADPKYLAEVSEAKKTEKYSPAGSLVTADGAVHPLVMEQGTGKVIDAVTQQAPQADDKLAPKGAPKGATLADPDARAIADYFVATGDDSRIRSLGFNPENKALVQKYVNEAKAREKVSDQELAERRQDYAANGISKNAGARTRATREENLNLVLKAANAAIPAALEESEKVKRYTGYVPLDRLIQKGQVVTNDQNLVTFGMANLQLAEHWARAMNPMGVMRESDRDLALHFLDTAFSKDTYKAAVMQLQKQITRERDAIREGKSTIPPSGHVEPGADSKEQSGSKEQTGAVDKPKPTQADIDYVKAHPEMKAKFVKRFGVEP